MFNNQNNMKVKRVKDDYVFTLTKIHNDKYQVNTLPLYYSQAAISLSFYNKTWILI